MRSFFQRKMWVVLLAALALGALTVLAFSLDNIPFNEAQHFVRSDAADTSSVSAQDVADAWADVPIWKQVVVWGLVSLMFLLVGLLISPELRKKLFRLFLQFVASVAAIFFLLRYYGPQLIALQQMAAQIGQQTQPANAQPM